jgi:hypothetical protein
MYQAAAPDGDAVQYHGAHGTPTFDSAQIRHRTDGNDLHPVRREDATEIILCTGPNDHRWTELSTERRGPHERKSSFEHARQVVPGN